MQNLDIIAIFTLYKQAKDKNLTADKLRITLLNIAVDVLPAICYDAALAC
jgi:hypothetical protein